MATKGVMPAGLKKYWAIHSRKGKSKSRSAGMPKHHRSHKLAIPVAMIAGFAPLVSITYTGYKAGGFNGAVSNAVTSVLPYDPIARRVTFANLGYGLFPIIAGMLVHKVVGGTLGVNRWLASSGIPWVRV